MTPFTARKLPGLVAGVLGGFPLFAIDGYVSPTVNAEVEPQFTVPILARVLYGGVTEELLLRWGLMTSLVWLTWRFLQGRRGTAQPIYVWLAIVLSALLFGVGHLSAAAIKVGELTGCVVLFVVGANATFGLLFGYLYWRYCLETSIIAHVTAHVVSFTWNLLATQKTVSDWGYYTSATYSLRPVVKRWKPIPRDLFIINELFAVTESNSCIYDNIEIPTWQRFSNHGNWLLGWPIHL